MTDDERDEIEATTDEWFDDDWTCHFCGCTILPADASEAICARVLAPAERACWSAEWSIDDLGMMESVCARCAEEEAGPNWREIGNARLDAAERFDDHIPARCSRFHSDAIH